MSGFGNDDFETQFYKLETSGMKSASLVKQQVRPLGKPLLPVVTQVNPTTVQNEQFTQAAYPQQSQYTGGGYSTQSQYTPPVYQANSHYSGVTPRMQTQTSMAQLSGVDTGSSPFKFALNEFKIPGWDDYTPEQQQAHMVNQKDNYNIELTAASNGVSLEEQIDKRTAADQKRLEEYLNITMRSEQIASIKKGFAIPSYASNIEIVNFPVSILIPPISNFGATKNVIPTDVDRKRLFGSIDNYGQGDYVQPLVDSAGFHYLGNLENAFICKIEISDIVSRCNFPVGLRVGEIEREFTPYHESMKFVGRKGERYHYIIPPLARVDGPVIVYVNSKDADHEYGYFYTHLTADENKIMVDNNIGESKDPYPSYHYKIDHPIARHLACYASKDGIQFPPIKHDRAYPYIEVKKTLAIEMARQIAELSRSKIPTRNLQKFDFQLVSMPGFEEHFDAWVKNDHESLSAKLLQQLVISQQSKDNKTDAKGYQQQSSITQVNTTPIPVYFNVSMTYIFRDEASVVYKEAIKQI